MKRRRRARPRWVHAGTQETTFTPNQEGGITNVTAALLLPPERVRYLCDTGQKDHLTTSAILIWLDFYVVADGSATTVDTQQTASPVDFYIMKTAFDTSTPPTDVPLNFLPYREPDVPSLITSWDTQGDEPDGLDAYLWTHHLGPIQLVNMDNQNASYNASDKAGSKSQGIGYVKSYSSVRQMWQPDIVVKTRRRLAKNEGIFLGFAVNNISQAGPFYIRYLCNVHWRILATV